MWFYDDKPYRGFRQDSDEDEIQDSAGYADMVTDMVTDMGFAVMVVMIATAIAMVVWELRARGLLPWLL